MDIVALLFACLDFALRETALFAAAGFALLGASDLALDLIWIGRRAMRRLIGGPRWHCLCADTVGPPQAPGWLAIFVPAWDEAAVIGRMLDHALATFDHHDYRLYVGCYPNDPATIAAVRASSDRRVRLVIGDKDGPTTKADCLNRLWTALRADEAASGRAAKAVILHDAEDVVHSAELKLFDRMIEEYDLVQLPVLPLIDPSSRWIAGHYADEFAEAHGKDLVVRGALGAGIPSAGVGCAFARDALAAIARANGGQPFSADSLTEDYELGLRLRALGGREAFLRLPRTAGRGMVVTRELFPSSLDAAVNQKARWMVGIALAGWDRLGWQGGFAERWMRLRDRLSVLAALLLCAGYAAFALAPLVASLSFATGLKPAPLPAALPWLIALNFGLLLWRLAMRGAFVTRAYGWREGLRSVPRVVVGNMIAMLAARRAVPRYARILRDGAAQWDKTAHAFPAEVPAE